MKQAMSNRIKILVIFCFTVFCSISCEEKTSARDIILQSLEAHGGVEKWNNVKELSYIKTTTLYDSLGNIEKRIIQTHKNTFIPKFEAQMNWIEDSIQKQAILKNDKTDVYFDGVLQNDAQLEEMYHKAIMAANYVIWQPYKLLDEDATLSYAGKEVIDMKSVDAIKANYFNENGSPTNTWWYYFDSKNRKLVSNMVRHGSTYSFIVNTKYENKTGLSLNAERKSYMTDSLRNGKFLRADYIYEILEIKLSE